MVWAMRRHIIFDQRHVIYDVLLYRYFRHSAGFVGTMFLLARALDAISDRAWACWPTVPISLGQIPTTGAVWRVAVWYRLCAGL